MITPSPFITLEIKETTVLHWLLQKGWYEEFIALADPADFASFVQWNNDSGISRYFFSCHFVFDDTWVDRYQDFMIDCSDE